MKPILLESDNQWSEKTKIPILIDSYEPWVVWLFCDKCSGYQRVDLKGLASNHDCGKQGEN